MLVFAYLGRIILHPIISIIEKWIGNRKWSIFIIILVLIILLMVLSRSLFPFIGNQITAFQSALTMETLTKFISRLLIILESTLPTFLFNLFNDIITHFDKAFHEI